MVNDKVNIQSPFPKQDECQTRKGTESYITIQGPTMKTHLFYEKILLLTPLGMNLVN